MRGDEARKLCAKAGVELQLVQVRAQRIGWAGAGGQASRDVRVSPIELLCSLGVLGVP